MLNGIFQLGKNVYFIFFSNTLIDIKSRNNNVKKIKYRYVISTFIIRYKFFKLINFYKIQDFITTI